MVTIKTFNAPNWADLSTPELDASIEFYRDLLGWEFATRVTEMGDYHVASVDGREVCGMMSHPPEMEGAPAMWTVFFHVEDIDEMVEKVGAAGGRVLEPPFEIPNGARVSAVADPTGAMFALISGETPVDGVWYSMVPGSVCWAETMTRDTETSATFYREIFGWEAEGEEGGYANFLLNGEKIAGLLPMPDMVPAEAPAHWAVYFTVESCEVAERTAVDLGGSVLVESMPVEIGHFAVLEDPGGAPFDVMDFSSTEEPAAV
jgi:predicted enzyme related to lactoylglutathione lyase